MSYATASMSRRAATRWTWIACRRSAGTGAVKFTVEDWPEGRYRFGMTTARDPRSAGHHFPAEVIATAAWLYFRFPLSLRMVEEMLAARGVVVSHETERRWALKFDREGFVLDVLVQSRRDKAAAKRLLRKLPRQHRPGRQDGAHRLGHPEPGGSLPSSGPCSNRRLKPAAYRAGASLYEGAEGGDGGRVQAGDREAPRTVMRCERGKLIGTRSADFIMARGQQHRFQRGRTHDRT